MIHDPEVEVTCDSCSDNIFVTPEYVYRDYSGNSGFYDFEESVIEEIIEKEHEWKTEGGKHYCYECWDEMTNGDKTV